MYKLYTFIIYCRANDGNQTNTITFLTIIIEGTKTVKCGQVYRVGQLP